MKWRLYILLAGTLIGFAVSHVIALQKINAMQAERPAGALDFWVD